MLRGGSGCAGGWSPAGVAGAGRFAAFLDPVAVVAGSFDRAGGRCVRGGWGVGQSSPEEEMAAVPVAIRRIRRGLGEGDPVWVQVGRRGPSRD